MWLHVDGAYGAPAVLTARGRALLAGIDRADSLVLDPHKWLFQPFEIGCGAGPPPPGALRAGVRDVPASTCATSAPASEVAFRDRGPQLSRGSRAMKLWLSLQVFGLDAFRAAIDRGIDLAERAEALLARRRGFEVVTPAQLAIVSLPRAVTRRATDALVAARGRRRLRGAEHDGPARPHGRCACARSTRGRPTARSTRRSAA